MSIMFTDSFDHSSLEVTEFKAITVIQKSIGLGDSFRAAKTILPIEQRVGF